MEDIEENLKSEEKYPSDKITFIEDKLKEIADSKIKMEESNKTYQAEILKADGLFNEAKFEEAITSYQSAKKIKENESYPDQKINEIKIKLNHISSILIILDPILLNILFKIFKSITFWYGGTLSATLYVCNINLISNALIILPWYKKFN